MTKILPIKRSRAAFLPSPGDPFVLLHCIHYFDTVWSSEVDKLYICINSDIEYDVVKELIVTLKHPKIITSYFESTLGHGTAINKMLDQCDEDTIMLIEDDSIIFKRGVVDSYFNRIESREYDVIGSPRMSCSKEVANSLAVEFNLNYEGWGDKGPNFWPCFFWTTKEHLLNTDRNFSATAYGDTLVWTSIQMRRSGLKILEVPQYHCSPDDEAHCSSNQGIFDGSCGYMHFGSLSSGIENTLLDERGYPLKDRQKPRVKGVERRTLNSLQEQLEIERRAMWWREAHTLNSEKFGEFGETYGKSIDRLIAHYGLSEERLERMRDLYLKVIHD